MGSGKAQEISLGSEFDAVVRYGRTTVALKADGNVIVKTQGNTLVYTNGDVKVPKPGARMPDGTIYAGVSPETGEAMYATPADAPLTCTFNEAANYAGQLNAQRFLGHGDWRVPTIDELNVLYNNRAKIGGFNELGSGPAGWYWSSEQDHAFDALGQRFSDGFQYPGLKGSGSSVRCVRG
jgi:hypothetical protein